MRYMGPATDPAAIEALLAAISHQQASWPLPAPTARGPSQLELAFRGPSTAFYPALWHLTPQEVCCTFAHMKAVQISIDEDLLRRLDALPEVKRHGRSAFIRDMAEAYLAHRRKVEIRDAYRRGYGAEPVREGEFDVEPEALAWPDD